MNSSTTATQPLSPKVVVCGSLHYDVVVNAPHLPRIDETVTGSGVNYLCGGKGGNQAVAAALNGAPTAFLGCIGDDEFGKQLVKHLQLNNVDCSGLQKTADASGMSVAIVDSNGDYGAVIVSASNLNIDITTIELPESTGILLLQNEVPDAVNRELALRATKRHIPVMLNAAPYRAISSELEKSISMLILNRVEAEQFFNTSFASTSEIETALGASDSTIETIIVTLGEQGLVYRDNNRNVQHQSAYPVSVSSSHGAGDMFCGTLASRIVAGTDLHAALDYAMATAAWYVSAKLTERSELNTSAIKQLLAKNL